jgi:2-enoate reductase
MKYLSCTVNPLTGMEKEYALTGVDSRKSVLVIGGGPGGMEAAAVAASRGCEVTLWEKSERLGGKLNLASAPDFKQDIRPLTAYLSRQVEKSGVKVALGRAATAGLVAEMNPDVVIIATGSVPRLPDISGVEASNVFNMVDLFQEERDPGDDVIVAGGGLCGCETAAYLAGQGKKVTIVEMADELMPEGVNINTMMGVHALLAQRGVEVLTGATLVEVNRGSAVVEASGGARELKADSVVAATGFAADLTLRDALEGRVPEVVAIGDCSDPRNILGAIWEGFHAARVL